VSRRLSPTLPSVLPVGRRGSDPSSIATFKLPLGGGGTSQQRLSFTMSGRGLNASRQDKPHPHSTFADPSGKFLLAPGFGADLIRVFGVD